MLFLHRRLAVPCSAPIADQHISHAGIQYHVDESRRHQDPDREQWLIKRPCHAAQNRSRCDKCQPQRGGKVFLPPDVLATADTTATQMAGGKVSASLVTRPVALTASHNGIRRLRRGDATMLAHRALEDDVRGHEEHFRKSGRSPAFSKNRASAIVRKSEQTLKRLIGDTKKADAEPQSYSSVASSPYDEWQPRWMPCT